MELAYRPPYDWNALLGFLAARAIPGVEKIDGDRYQRTISIDGKVGSFSVQHAADGPALLIEIDGGDSRALPMIVERVRRMFDVDADPAVIAAQLSGDVLLKGACAAHPGLRTPGAWDPFELTVRAILGQQISVAAATTIAGRVASRWGTPIDHANGLTHLFPTPPQIVNAPLEEAGIISSRATTLRSVAKAIISGQLVFDGVSTGQALRSIPGIGDWTAQYVLMRALNEPNAFPSGDLVLKRMAGGCTAAVLERRSEAWRPWRAYAVMLLWQAARDQARRDAINTGRAAAVRTKIVACVSRSSVALVSEKARSSGS
jgi:AraC family transcriptional regulator of adaptative response / DNA-3-methyladenine glycosylase II